LLRKSHMNEFLIECSFKSYSMASKLVDWSSAMPFWSRAMRHIEESRSSAMRHSAGSWSSPMPHSAGSIEIQILNKKSPVLCGIAWDHGVMLCRIARDHGPAICQHSADHIYSLISRRIRNQIRKYFTAWIRGLNEIFWWKKPEVKNLATLSL
jgi:hypothetical protein